MKTAMKAGDSSKLMTLRGLISVLNNKSIEKRAKTGTEEPMTDEEVTNALLTEAKKRKESMEVFKTGGRPELAENEAKELAVIQEYLPKQLSAEETTKMVTEIVNKAGSKEFGPVMKMVMAELRGKADAALVTEIVKKKLGA